MYTYFIVAIFILVLVMQNKSRGMKQSIEKLVRQSARYATAAQQDKSPVIAVLHANYAAAYLYALKDIATESQIHNATGINVKKFKEHVLNVQDMVTKKTTESCPEFAGNVDIYLAEIGGEA
ncbi:hypothetical protein FK873_gp183 [Micromonas pusilla virus SP1]|jgi:hypothetical protein|uniref:Uncharacterized protein n=1 Tax=Micromonas pusilla virus SP1 TaxID=373996 RepID=G9E6C8_MPSP1|nr:hypothetical protein FK873_gp183 [Micromonas pusilla virus SP1]AET84955.1 hypothetical protein MPXG_00157 [Micromonas pusilla virus SP1]